MTTHSLHSIVKIENELHARELAEREKADQWLREQQEKILAQHRAGLDAMAGKKEEVLEKARTEAEREAAAIIARAGEKAAVLDRVNDERLSGCIDKHLVAIITGAVP